MPETLDLYPDLVVSDERCGGAVTAGRSRLPLWSFIPEAVFAGWPEALADHPTAADYTTPEAMREFVFHLLQVRGDFARLLLALAAAERHDDQREPPTEIILEPQWWEASEEHREQVADLLRRCLRVVEG